MMMLCRLGTSWNMYEVGKVTISSDLESGLVAGYDTAG